METYFNIKIIGGLVVLGLVALAGISWLVYISIINRNNKNGKR